MSYPNFKDKHLEQALFNPKDFVNWRIKINKSHHEAPKKYVLIYYQNILNHFQRKYHPKKTIFNKLITYYQYKDVGVVRMTGIGSPHAAVVLEELIALGGKEFINVGSAGGLRSFGFFLCEKSLRDEGTSYHYIHHDQFAHPDKKLTQRFEKILLKKSLPFQKSISWTIDAPYRETKAEIQKYRKEGVSTVEMESSALFTVAKVRKVKIASAFVVSDILGEKKWDPQFNAKHVNQNLNKLFDVALECLLNK